MTEQYRVDVLAAGESNWASNALRFDSKEAALAYADDLSSRWLLVVAYRAVLDSVPQRQPFNREDADRLFS
jgi:hypothetical protein